jgi:hypothetical protein
MLESFLLGVKRRQMGLRMGRICICLFGVQVPHQYLKVASMSLREGIMAMTSVG